MYTIRLRPEEGGFVVTCDQIPGMVEQGEDIHDALFNMGKAMAFTLEDEGAITLIVENEGTN